MITRQDITACLLAGGQGQRLGGSDKGLVELGSRPLIEYCLERLAPQVDDIIISANRNQAHYQRYATQVVPDSFAGYAGPLAGLLSACEASDHRWVLMVPCDSPWLPLDLAARLTQTLQSGEYDIATVTSGGYTQPVFACVRRELGKDLAGYLREGGRKITAWYARHRYVEVNFDNVEAFTNINTPDDLKTAQQRLDHA